MANKVLNKLLDTKTLLHIYPHHGEREKILEWKWSFYVTPRAMSRELYDALKLVEDNLNTDFTLSRLSEEQRKLASQSYMLRMPLAHLRKPCECTTLVETM